MAVDIAKGPIGHWDQTNAVFAFWQEIVDLAPAYAKQEAAQGFLERFSTTLNRHCEKRSDEAIQ